MHGGETCLVINLCFSRRPARIDRVAVAKLHVTSAHKCASKASERQKHSAVKQLSKFQRANTAPQQWACGGWVLLDATTLHSNQQN